MKRDESNRVYWFETRFLFSLFVGCFYHKGPALSKRRTSVPGKACGPSKSKVRHTDKQDRGTKNKVIYMLRFDCTTKIMAKWYAHHCHRTSSTVLDTVNPIIDFRFIHI